MRTLASLAALLSLAALAACGSPSRPNNGDDDDGSNGVDAGSDGSGSDGSGSDGSGDGCSAAAQFVYVVDENYDLSKFNPVTKQFTQLVSLDICNDSFATPFSMGVDRNANAYVLFNDSTLYQVTGLKNGGPYTCTQTSFQPSGDLAQFGMGFSTTTSGGSTDQLFIAGGDSLSGDTSGPATLAQLDTSTFQTTTVGTVSGWPELTGTSAAELWGFFPDASHPRIDNINKTSGAAMTSYSLTALRGTPSAWAFAAYGGDLWVFLMKDSETSTTVYQIGGPTSGAPGTVKSTTLAGGRTIVGAGVSTCAPIVIGLQN